jgi:tetratricopeptide (TPR) repeat protein
MGTWQHERYGFPFGFRPGLKRAVLCCWIAGLSAAPLAAQRPRIGARTPVTLLPKMPDDRVVVDKGISQSGIGNKTCSLQPFPGMPDTVSVTALQIPEKAQKEYDEACANLKKNKLPETEQHLRKATDIYPQYVAGWVMLGQILDQRQEPEKARDACSRASSADSKYLPAYLCLAEIAGREQKWDEVLKMTSRALELDAEHDAYAYFFSAAAHLNLDQLPEAEATGLKAEAIDKDHYEPLIQFLLAQIYEAKNDAADAASHLREYLKIVPDAQDAENVKKELAQDESAK